MSPKSIRDAKSQWFYDIILKMQKYGVQKGAAKEDLPGASLSSSA
jgi:hypothetical protein